MIRHDCFARQRIARQHGINTALYNLLRVIVLVWKWHVSELRNRSKLSDFINESSGSYLCLVPRRWRICLLSSQMLRTLCLHASNTPSSSPTSLPEGKRICISFQDFPINFLAKSMKTFVLNLHRVNTMKKSKNVVSSRWNFAFITG